MHKGSDTVFSLFITFERVKEDWPVQNEHNLNEQHHYFLESVLCKERRYQLCVKNADTNFV